jgi:hypothetical protein
MNFMHQRVLRGAAIAAVLALAACNSSPPPVASAPPQASVSSYTPSSFRLPGGAGCSGDVANWQAIQDNDRRMGQVQDAVYAQIRSEIAQAAEVCAAGRDAEASAMVRASKARHGYPG